ncbi:hypothetical protein L3Q82_026186 [Scortum barcoo]|uniref:Uncharacterized protein n=1 Tax=Scortum barcoo TaxID=214431 RepID=A0ACB8WI26_9TELE|nr:hypothetical protein L3Q82_026186 [Scortum barcoo]
MKSVASTLLLLFSLCPAVCQGQSVVSAPQEHLPVLWDELWGLKELVLSLKAADVEQRQALRSMESRVRDGEVEAEQQKRSLDELKEATVRQEEELRSTEATMETDRKLLMELNSGLRGAVEDLKERSRAQAGEFLAEVSMLQSRLNTSERSVDDLKRKNSAKVPPCITRLTHSLVHHQTTVGAGLSPVATVTVCRVSTALASELPFLQTRLRASESTVEQLRRKNAVLAARLCNTESLMEELMRQTSAVPASNSSSPSEVSELERRLNVRLEELNTNTHGQVSELSSRLNLSQLHLDELRGNSADQTGLLTSVERRVEELETENTGQPVDVSALTDTLSVTERRLSELQTQTTGEQTAVTSYRHPTKFQADSVQQLQAETTTQEVRLRSTETQLEQLLNHTAVQSAQLSLMDSRLSDSHNNTAEFGFRLSANEKQLEDLKTENTELEVRLSVSEEKLDQLENHTAVHAAELSTVTLRLNLTAEQVDELTTQNTDRLTAAERETEVLQVQLRVGEASVNQLKTENNEIHHRLEAAENHNSVLQSRLSVLENQLKRLFEGFQIKLRDRDSVIDSVIQELQSNMTGNGRHTRPLIISLDLGLHARSHPVGVKMITRTVSKNPRTTRGDLVNDLQRAGTKVTKATSSVTHYAARDSNPAVPDVSPAA